MAYHSCRRLVHSLFFPKSRIIRREADRFGFRPRLECLETRLAPATNITVVLGAMGSGAQDSAFVANHGQLLFSASNVGANTLSTGALASIAAGSGATSTTFNTIGSGVFDTIGGTLGITGQQGFQSNTLSFTNVHGAVNINDGLAATPALGGMLDIENSTFDSMFVYHSNNGNTTAKVQTSAGTTTFKSSVSLYFAAGDDTLNLASGGIVHLVTNSLFDGGGGTNTLNENSANLVFTTPPMFHHWS